VIQKVLLVDDEESLRDSLRQSLELAGLQPVVAASADAAIGLLEDQWPGIVLSDLRMPGMSGFDLLAAIQDRDPDLPVILLTGHGDIPMAVQAMTLGAYDFIEKPCPQDRLLEVVQRACEKRRLVLENRLLRRRLQASGQEEIGILGDAPATQLYRGRLEAIAQADVDVLIEGETGVGKELAARALHGLSACRNGPFVAINCGALPGELIGSELFGHESGAFTGASSAREGKFEHANGGLLFLDEIESMPLDLQVKLLRVLQEREIERLGSNKKIPLRVRVVAATKEDLLAAAKQGRFREDLYYRLDVARLAVPPLRARLEDVELLFRHFLHQAAERQNKAVQPLPSELAGELTGYGWPGNVRELRNAAERYQLGLGLTLGGQILTPKPEDAQASLPTRVEAYEKRLIAEALQQAGGNVTRACGLLGLPRKTLYDKFKKHGLSRSDFLEE
jgi:two-component system C4-dicarboxylate transport response regulator DctD|tara:strand:- start:379 stop:1728 length:1350 start_codon:yes stop_codon:yes gene_type:complete